MAALHMKVLVTGGAGFIGSHVVDALVARGDKVVVIDNLSSGSLAYLPPAVDFKRGSVEIPETWPDMAGVDAIVHLAARPSVAESWSSILEAHHDNLSATLCVISMAIHHRVARIVFASSAAVYGEIGRLPINEASAHEPLSPYGLQKLVSEAYLRLHARRSEYSAVNLRFFNVYGERQSAKSEYAGVIAKFLTAARAGTFATVYGNGLQTRDFIHVSDIVLAIIAAIDASLDKGTTLSLNVGTGVQTTLMGLIQSLREVTGAALPLTFEVERTGDILRSVADTSAAEAAIRFRAQTTLTDGLRRYCRWLELQKA
jgi:UDP-glucose 4-epimerase